MLVYLVRLTDRVTGKVAHKVGHTKWGPANVVSNRFRRDRDYDTFDIDLLGYAMLSHENFIVAKTAIITIENMFRAIVPAKDPGFMIEEYFEREPGTMKVGGVTEFIFVDQYDQNEETLVWVFDNIKKAVEKTEKDLRRL